MKSAQARDDARKDTLANQLSADATPGCDAAATTEESTYRGGRVPLILQGCNVALVQQSGWQRPLDEAGAFLCGKELARELIGLGGGMDHTRHGFLLSPALAHVLR